MIRLGAPVLEWESGVGSTEPPRSEVPALPAPERD
jgi:hypothetical protein